MNHPTKRPYRILSLDGGGTWSLIQVVALRHIFGDVHGRSLLANFDLVAANSGGAVVAGALAEDMCPSEIEEYFLSAAKRRTLFVGLSWSQKYLSLDALLRFFHI